MHTTTFVYDDPEHPDRPTSTISSPAYTPEDQALLMALEAYEADLCVCGVPRSVGWHTEMDGYFEAERYVCFACTAKQGDDATEKAVYTVPVDTRGHDKPPLPPFVLGVTTTDS